MSDLDPDLEMILADMRQEFIEETSDKLEEIENSIRAIENNSGSVDNNVMEIKRLMHSIKGSGRSFGFPVVSQIAHGFENYLETSGDVHSAMSKDMLLFVDSISKILETGVDPINDQIALVLEAMPTGGRHGGKQAKVLGKAMVLMPRGVQRKIIAQELAHFGFKVTILDSALAAIDMAMTIKPDFVITTMQLDSMSGVELAWALRVIQKTSAVRCAVVTADEITDSMVKAMPPTARLIRKGPLFAGELMAFIRG